MEQQVDSSVGRERLMASLSVFFGSLALLLTSIGLYGVVAYNVTRRKGEIGIRMARSAPNQRSLARAERRNRLRFGEYPYWNNSCIGLITRSGQPPLWSAAD
jgi:hypothetical protein